MSVRYTFPTLSRKDEWGREEVESYLYGINQGDIYEDFSLHPPVVGEARAILEAWDIDPDRFIFPHRGWYMTYQSSMFQWAEWQRFPGGFPLITFMRAMRDYVPLEEEADEWCTHEISSKGVCAACGVSLADVDF